MTTDKVELSAGDEALLREIVADNESDYIELDHSLAVGALVSLDAARAKAATLEERAAQAKERWVHQNDLKLRMEAWAMRAEARAERAEARLAALEGALPTPAAAEEGREDAESVCTCPVTRTDRDTPHHLGCPAYWPQRHRHAMDGVYRWIDESYGWRVRAHVAEAKLSAAEQREKGLREALARYADGAMWNYEYFTDSDGEQERWEWAGPWNDEDPGQYARAALQQNEEPDATP